LINRREFLAGSAAFYVSSQLALGAADDSLVVNDIHSQLNRTRVECILRPKSAKELQAAILTAKRAKKPLSIAGGRHAMGGQQFGTDMILVDMRGLNQIVSFDSKRGLVEVQAGAFWPEFTAAYLHRQQGVARQWGFAQKQTGATISALEEHWRRTLMVAVFPCSRSLAISSPSHWSTPMATSFPAVVNKIRSFSGWRSADMVYSA
jgi:FAD/FMN-containing dehydrogenase